MKNKNSLTELVLRVVILMVGLTIAHLGVTLFLLADLGADPFNVLIQGIYRLVSGISLLTHGRVHMAISFLIILVLLIVDKSYIRIGTLLCMICGGPIIDFFNYILAPLFANDPSLPVRILANCLGCVILAYGMTIVIKSEAGTGPNDLVAVVISDKSRKPFGIIRVVVDLCFAATGFIMGGTLGLGTIICAFLVGPVAGVFLPFNEKIIQGILKKIL